MTKSSNWFVFLATDISTSSQTQYFFPSSQQDYNLELVNPSNFECPWQKELPSLSDIPQQKQAPHLISHHSLLPYISCLFHLLHNSRKITPQCYWPLHPLIIKTHLRTKCPWNKSFQEQHLFGKFDCKREAKHPRRQKQHAFLRSKL